MFILMMTMTNLVDSNYTWIFLIGVFVFIFLVIILLCFTKTTGERLFLGNIDDPEVGGTIDETPALLASLTEDARLSYERAKGKHYTMHDMNNITKLAISPQYSNDDSHRIVYPLKSLYPNMCPFKRRGCLLMNSNGIWKQTPLYLVARNSSSSMVNALFRPTFLCLEIRKSATGR
jgi:hypothetical protein